MPCPEIFRETLIQLNIPQEITSRINQGFKKVLGKSTVIAVQDIWTIMEIELTNEQHCIIVYKNQI